MSPRRSLARASLRFRAARWLLRRILGSLFAIDVRGLDNVPRSGYIVACNHLNWVDPFILLGWLPATPRVHVLGRRSAIYNRAWKRWILDFFGGVIPIEPGPGNQLGIEEVNDALSRGASLALFPEGGVGMHEGEVQPLKHGVVHFAQRSGLPIVPVGLCGTRELWLRKPISVAIGDSLRVAAGPVEVDVERLACALRDVLPRYEEPAGPRRWRWLTTLLR